MSAYSKSLIAWASDLAEPGSGPFPRRDDRPPLLAGDNRFAVCLSLNDRVRMVRGEGCRIRADPRRSRDQPITCGADEDLRAHRVFRRELGERADHMPVVARVEAFRGVGRATRRIYSTDPR